MKQFNEPPFPFLRIAALTVVALFVHGYHLGVEDGEIYVPAALKLLHPHLYPFAAEFFLSHEHLSLFATILAWSARFTHLSMGWTVFAWYLLGLFATIGSIWLIASACFVTARARWSSVLITTAVLAMPATNTGLLLIDPYLTARSFSTPLTLFALFAMLQRKYAVATIGILLTASVHPQMAAYLLALGFVFWVAERHASRVRQPIPAMASAIGILPTSFALTPATGAYREALHSRDYFFLYNWAWYHWLGLLAPLAILAWFWKRPARNTTPNFSRLSFVLLPFGLLSILVAALFSTSPAFDMLQRLQPLRTFHLITLVFVILLAGFVGEYLGQKRPWAIGALSASLALGMYVVARQTYPRSAQIELPANRSSNPWVDTLLWIRHNTPENAVFAVDSRYFNDPASDAHGFRALSERSSLADYYKDGGVVSLFPALADEWKHMTDATYGLNHFTQSNFKTLHAQYPQLSWTVIHGSAPAGMKCPHTEGQYAVCILP